MSGHWIQIGYLVASVLFILGLKGLGHPRTAPRGNFMSALAMLLAVIVTLIGTKVVSFDVILAGLVVGTAIGVILAVKIRMTAMPELVALFNGFGGGASVLVSAAALIESQQGVKGLVISPSVTFLVATGASAIIGAVTFWGSLVAFAKLLGKFGKLTLRFPGMQAMNGLIAIGAVVCAVMVTQDPGSTHLFWIAVALASILGVTAVMPIGGADMPVVIALLNSLSGLAAAAIGFVLSNSILIIAGSLVGASGLILTQIMCKAMNRSLFSVLFSEFTAPVVEQCDLYTGRVKNTSPDEVAMLFDVARRVSIVPGYGLAVSQAQHAVRDLSNLLATRGVEVEFAIHPVAGRMPGHMNVLLAEANIPYDQLRDLDEANAGFEVIDVAIVIGANDVVNPLARTDPHSPIAGMPILNVDQARTVVVIKRSLSHGFAGIANPLFAADNSLMLFGDGRKMIQELIAALKEA